MHPVLFEIPTPWGTLPVYSYGVMLGCSMIAAWYLVMYLGERKEGFGRELMANTFIVTAVVAIVGARLLYILTNLEEFSSPAQWFALRSGGLVAYGGFLGGLLGSWAYLRYKNASLLGWADVVAPTLGLGLALTRVGCYLYGCDYGAPLSEGSPQWLKDLGTFPRRDDGGSPAWAHHVAEYDLSPTADASLPVHPTQIYESLAGLVILGAALLIWRHRHFRGQVILAVTMLYGIWRFLIEYVRDDPERGFYIGFSTSQLISLGLVPLAAFLYHTLRKQQGDTPVPVPATGPPPKADRSEGPLAKGDGADEAGAPKKPKKKKRKAKKRR
ncbi:MAG TPA: prolipoprotein diacylglyceryl transferase [Sandaracinaceae bacterium LLY-WYZ-13_1]|nr:prolipoprotein diacylglyceryl transferase [Sandaracinaceae bacterium LLY-WYZ-13_1]